MRRNLPILILLVCFLILAVTYSAINPPFEAPDEIWHYAYVHWFAEGNGLPQPADFGTAAWAQEGSQAPLYYVLASLPLRLLPDTGVETVRYNPHAAPGDGAAFGNRNQIVHDGTDAWPWRGPALGLHVTRLVSILLGAVTVFLAYWIGRAAVPGWPAAALMAAGLVAFNPQFLFINSAVTNDALVTTVCTAGLWLSIWGAGNPRWAEGSRRWLWWALLGLLAGLAALSKVNGLLLSGLVVLTLTFVALRARSWRLWFASILVFAAVALAAAGWWYWRNWQLFGDPLAVAALTTVMPGRDTPAGVGELLTLAPGVWRSLWAVFGWFNVLVAEPVHWFYAALALFAVGGWLGALLSRRSELNRVWRGAAVAALALWLLAVTMAATRWAQINFAQGRLLFPALASLAVLLAIGLLAWWPRARQRTVAVVLSALLAGIAAVIPFLWIAPAYAPPAPLAADASPPNALSARFGANVELLGYAITPTTALVGDVVEITLYWRTNAALNQDYSVFVHGVDGDELLQVQRDSYPGMGNLPTPRWAPGQIYPDRHRLVIPPTVLAPAQLRIDVGLYDAATGTRLPQAGQDALAIGTITVVPPPGGSEPYHPRRIDFDGKIALLGFDLSRTRLAPGDSVELTLWWEALQPLDTDYVAFAHLVLPPDAVWAQQDQMPLADGVPTSGWAPGTPVADRRTIELPETLPPGDYQVAIGLYDKDTFERLPVNFDDRAILLAQVKVEPKP